MLERQSRRGNQEEYKKLLDAFNAKNKQKSESVHYLIDLGFSYIQAQNAVHVYWKGGDTRAIFVLSKEQRNLLLDEYGAVKKTPKECVSHLMNYGCTYRQATSAVYKYRQEKGLIGE
jgi:hypothetical protein